MLIPAFAASKSVFAFDRAQTELLTVGALLRTVTVSTIAHHLSRFSCKTTQNEHSFRDVMHSGFTAPCPHLMEEWINKYAQSLDLRNKSREIEC